MDQQKPRRLRDELASGAASGAGLGFGFAIEAAKKLNLPYIIHCREAYEDCFEIIKNNNYYNGVIHSFSSNLDMAIKFIDLGLYIGISGPITFKNGIDQKEVAKLIPIDRILVETDAPYLTPVPYRGKRNEPSYTAHTAEVGATIYGVDYTTFANQTTKNFNRLFSKAAI